MSPVRTLLVDNHDSFTFNLFHLIAAANGEPPVVIRNDELAWHQLDLAAFDNVVLSPGPGSPERPADVGICTRLIREADLPLLGVCLGHQAIGMVYGGSIVHAPEPVHGRVSVVSHDGSSRLLRGLPPSFRAVRYHSLLVASPLPGALRATASTGDGLVMALEHRSLPRHGVQFHPESIGSEQGEALLRNFRDLTRERRPRASVSVPAPLAPSAPSAPPAPAPLALRHRRLRFGGDAADLFEALFGGEPEAFWLDSSRVEPGLSRFSVLGAPGPHGASIRCSLRAGAVEIRERGGERVEAGSIFDVLRRELARLAIEPPPFPFDFCGGFVGFLGYELGAGGQAEQAPDAAFVLADRSVVVDHEQREAYLLCLAPPGDEEAFGWLAQAEAALGASRPAPADAAAAPRALSLRLARGRQRYLDDIARCHEFLRDGESYELCLTNQIEVRCELDWLHFYRTLRARNPAPYAAFLRLGGVTVACSSPERFLKIDAAGNAESKPIKGTCPRGDSPERDEALRRALAGSEKDRSENLMIVDLLRNDLGRVCEVGSVTVPSLMAIESYATVHQMVSTVRGKLGAGVSPVDCVEAAFPGGSMTGAPKQRTMRLLASLEQAPRGVYSGAIGYFSLGGAVDLNIVIRTLVATPSATTIGVGGAVVALSGAEAEFEETLLKARALVGALLAAAGHATPVDAVLDALRSRAEASVGVSG